ncbi:YlxQ-related RNA-binding protein [Lapidilactobacillus salsurivasis]
MSAQSEQQTKTLNLLGLARRAQQLVMGEGLVVEAARHGQLRLIFVASDLGPNTMKRIKNKANFYQIPMIEVFSAAQLTHAIGASRKVIGVKDAGFAKGMVSLMQ